MYLALGHFELTQMTTTEGAKWRIRKPLLVPTGECPQGKSPPNMPTHEIGALHVVRKSNNPFNISLCCPGEQKSGWCAVLFSTAASSSQPTSATWCMTVCFICRHIWFPTARPSSTANQGCLAGIDGLMKLVQFTQDMASGSANCQEEGLSFFHICILISTLWPDPWLGL